LNKILNYIVSYKISEIKLVFLIFLILNYQNFLMIFSPLTGDQLFHISIKGYQIQTFNSFLEFLIDETLKWMLLGDISILHRFITLFFSNYLIQNILLVKLFYFILIIGCLFLFSYLIYELTNNRWFAYLTIILTPILFQYQNWHDVFLIFPLYIAPLFILLISSLIFFVRYLKQNNTKNYLISLNFIFLSCLMSPVIVAPFLTIFIITNYHFKNKIFDKDLLKFLIIPTVFVLFVFYLNFFMNEENKIFKFISSYTISEITYDGRQIIFSLLDLVKSFFIQTSSALPLIFFLRDGFNFSLSFVYFDFLFFIIYFLVLKNIFENNDFKLKQKKIYILLLAFNLIFIALPVCLSKKYVLQLQQMGIGYGYIYNFYQFFGVGLILILSIQAITNKLQKFIYFKVLIALLIAIVGTLTIAQNRAMIEKKYKLHDAEIQTYFDAATKNFFSELPEFSNIFFETGTLSVWNSPQFLSSVSEKIFFSTWYDTKLVDYYLNDNELLLKNNKYQKIQFILDKLHLKENNKNYYSILKRNKDLSTESKYVHNKIKKKKYINIIKKSLIYENSDKVYLIKSFLSHDDILILKGKIKNFIIKQNIIRDIELSDVEIFSKNENKVTYSTNVINLNSLINKIENKNFLNNQEKKNENFHSVYYESINTHLNFDNEFSGSISCNLKKLNIKKNSIFLPISQNFVPNESLILKIENNSNRNWNINEFDKKNPITLRTILKNKSSQQTAPGPGTHGIKLSINSGFQKSIYISQIQVAEILSQIDTNTFNLIEFHLVEEGKRFFAGEDKLFEPCIITLSN